jgi:hypothetical protein
MRIEKFIRKHRIAVRMTPFVQRTPNAEFGAPLLGVGRFDRVADARRAVPFGPNSKRHPGTTNSEKRLLKSMNPFARPSLRQRGGGTTAGDEEAETPIAYLAIP